MTTKIKKSLLLTAGLSTVLMSCSKQEDVQPIATSITAIPSTNAQVKIVNGRVVFADLTALNQTQDALNKLGNSQASTQALADWEKNLGFASLRAAASSEDSHLEALETQGVPTPAHDLMYKFGFPLTYASLINPVGEYQVGGKIYWFHDGLKYQANSEEELAAIKKNPSAAKVKLSAGYKTIKNTKGLPTGETNRTIAGDDPYADNKYNHEFTITGESGSRRRTIYDINVFTDDRGTDYGGFYHFWYTSLNLQIKYEYYSYGKRKWYPVNETFNWTTNVSFDATPSIPYQNTPAGTQRGSANYTNSFSNGIQVLTLASQDLTTSTVDPYLNKGQISWNFEIGGSIEGAPNRDSYNLYRVSSGTLW